MINELVLEEQSKEDGLPEDSEFTGVPAIFTDGFEITFGDDYLLIGERAIELLIEKYPQKNWQYLQIYSYKGVEFWCISDAFQNKRVEHEHITFLMPDEY